MKHVVASLVLLLLGASTVAMRPLESPALAFRSSPIAITVDGKTVVTVNPDSGSISLLNVENDQVVEMAAGANPQTVSIRPDDFYAYVTLRDEDALAMIPMYVKLPTRKIPTADEPFGVVAGGDGRLYVSCSGADVVQVFDAQGTLVREISTEPMPRGLALWGNKLHVTHFLTGALTVIDTTTLAVEKVIGTGIDSNLAQSVEVDIRARVAYMPMTRSNSSNPALLFDTTLFPIVSVIDLATGENLMRRRIAIDIADKPVDMPIDSEITSNGRLIVVHAGSDDLSIINVGTGFGEGHIEVESNPRGIVLSPDEKFAYVNNTLSGSVSVIDLTARRLLRNVRVTTIPLPGDILNGKILFHNSSRTSLAKDQWISCAACHPDGETDGRTWFFRDGPRNTTSLLGTNHTAPWHWSGDLDELQDVESTIRTIQAGSGLAPGPVHCDPACDKGPPNGGRSKDLDDLSVFMRSLAMRPNPNIRPNGSLTPEASRGRELFFSSRTRCGECHPAPLFTDLKKHDVGTGRLSPREAKGTIFDTPSLRRIDRTAPYLHDGSAATLLDVLTTQNRDNLHGRTSDLSERELDDLVAFLKALPYEPKRKHGARR